MTTSRSKRYFSASPTLQANEHGEVEREAAVKLFLKTGGVIRQCAEGETGYVNNMSAKRNLVLAKRPKGGKNEEGV
jgi:hypothetical protein